MSNVGTLNNIRSKIETMGSLDMSSFMQNVLSHNQYGYYVNKSPIGHKGDFITAPEVSQMFGEMVGLWVMDSWMKLNFPKNFVLVELGPGKGTLMRDILRATKHIKGFHDSFTIYFVEISKPHIELQKEMLKDFPNIKFNWIKTVFEIPKQPVIIVANEFFDAMPINQYVKNRYDWYEVAVSIEPQTGDFKFIELLLSSELANTLNNEYPHATHRSYLETSPLSISYIKHLATLVKDNTGAAIIIDYGYNENNLDRKNFHPTVQAIKNHKFHPILSEVGDADLSAHVDFFALAEAVATRGVIVKELTSQREFLLQMGIEVRAQILKNKASAKEAEHIELALMRLTSNEQMGNLFKVMSFYYPSI